MAELKYDETGRLLFTKEMKKEYTLLMPQMLPIHFEFIKQAFLLDGFKVEVLDTTHRGIVEEGLRHVHNDICFPAMLVIGQLIDALKSGKYDLDKVALMMTQTGGGCRASNYIHLLRKGVKKAGYEKIPVVSLNLSGLEKNEGFKLNFRLVKRLIYALIYGDVLMWLSNHKRAHERVKGTTDDLLKKWIIQISNEFSQPKKLSFKNIKINMENIVLEFSKIPVKNTNKPKVGIVGEIYVKFAPLGNNNLEKFLEKEGAEIVVPGLIDFLIFKSDNRIEDSKLYGTGKLTRFVASFLVKLLKRYQNLMVDVITKHNNETTETKLPVPSRYDDIKNLVKGYLGFGNKMGEGWLLTAEMLELIHSGVPNIVCTQPFGCLPNHIVGKGMIRAIREHNPGSNVVAIDYDPGTSPVNQENRLKLMLTTARKNLESDKSLSHEAITS